MFHSALHRTACVLVRPSVPRRLPRLAGVPVRAATPAVPTASCQSTSNVQVPAKPQKADASLRMRDWLVAVKFHIRRFGLAAAADPWRLWPLQTTRAQRGAESGGTRAAMPPSQAGGIHFPARQAHVRPDLFIPEPTQHNINPDERFLPSPQTPQERHAGWRRGAGFNLRRLSLSAHARGGAGRARMDNGRSEGDSRIPERLRVVL